MFNVLTMNKISEVGLRELGEAYAVSDACENPDGIIVRSASLHEYTFGDSVAAVARAGAGVNNIPVDICTEKGIVVFNTPGANANAVKELVVGGLILASRRVAAGIEWCKTLKGQGDAVGKLVEKGKSQFAGPEIAGKTLGVIGLGAIGRLVAGAANALGMSIVGYDPFLNDGVKADEHPAVLRLLRQNQPAPVAGNHLVADVVGIVLRDFPDRMWQAHRFTGALTLRERVRPLRDKFPVVVQADHCSTHFP